jgi:hypothetical protein
MARYKIPVHVGSNRTILLEYLGIDARGGMVKLPRELGEPPERYGPYRPIAKALP